METLHDVDDADVSTPPLNDPRVQASSTDTATLYVQLVYEDAQTGLRARYALDRLADALKLEADFHVELLRFNLLSDPALREAALEQAARADILLVSAHGWGGLPATVSLWLKEWLASDPGRPRALVLSLDVDAGNSAAASRLLESFQAVAASAGVEVFPHFSDALGTDRTLTIESLQHRAEAKTSLLDETMRRIEPYSHWGLNE
ncbi:hypothetical protein SBV1_1580012 [Verrucomicrobia bacterium]|nr:hypothetical protein SBV1_1580012 [Verrucomicrobiota bacterium]